MRLSDDRRLVQSLIDLAPELLEAGQLLDPLQRLIIGLDPLKRRRFRARGSKRSLRTALASS